MNPEAEKAYVRLSRSLSRRQKCDIMQILDECRLMGATFDQIVPIYSLVMFEKPKLTAKEKAFAKKLEAKARKCINSTP
jgi:hypothetical protein